MRILISPHSRPLRPGVDPKINPDAINPKNYPYWQELIDKLIAKDHSIVQIGRAGEEIYNGTESHVGLPLVEVEALAREADLWISVENFLPHLCNAQKVLTGGVVIFSRSDPKIFGYFQNKNLLKSREYLRPDQFHIWEQCEYVLDAFMTPDEILNTVKL